jgi:DNA polymerase IV
MQSAIAGPRRILLADADAFFCAVARMVDPEGAGKARLLIVGGGGGSRGVVCSASYEARRFGVRSAMPMSRARRLCPGALCVPVPGRACGEKSRAIRRVLSRFAPIVEAASIDEWYLDLTGTETLYHDEPLSVTAAGIRQAVIDETGLSVSIGGGTGKMIAKLAADVAKPRPETDATGVFVVEQGSESRFMRRFALADIPFVGPKFQVRLQRLGLRTVDDALALDSTALMRMCGERGGRWLYDRIRGIEDSHVEGMGEAKSLSREETFPTDLRDDADLGRELLRLAVRAAEDLRHAGLRARTVTVKIRDADFTTRQASRTVPEAIESERAIAALAGELLRRLRRARRVGVRLLGVSLSNFGADRAPRQLALFADDARSGAPETERDRSLSRAVDRLRSRYGPDAVLPAALLHK